MKTYLKLGGVVFCLDSERTLDLSGENLSPFLISPVSEPDITVTVTWDWQGTRHPSTPPLGRDMIQIYYREGEDWFCENDGGDRGALSCVRYREDSSHFLCAVNEVTCQVPQNNLLNVIRMLPIRGILRRFDVVFLHASQIAVGGKGILFTAPSGTGKTTQARLWQLCRGADILCNDRTLLRRVGERWMTYGVPFDGSAPVCSGVSLPLGAIIHLVQGECDRVERISGLASLAGPYAPAGNGHLGSPVPVCTSGGTGFPFK